MTNDEIARRLLEYARGLDPRTNLYRARSYRNAALLIQRLDISIAELLKSDGRVALAALPGVGGHLAFTLEKLIETGEVVPWSARKTASPTAALGNVA
ncbi:MAG: hypothetical protein ACJ8F7_13015 [Gemmataceae bacterium]